MKCIKYNNNGQSCLVNINKNDLTESTKYNFFTYLNTKYISFVLLEEDTSIKCHIYHHILRPDDDIHDTSNIYVMKEGVNQTQMNCNEDDILSLFLFFGEFKERYGLTPY